MEMRWIERERWRWSWAVMFHNRGRTCFIRRFVSIDVVGKCVS